MHTDKCSLGLHSLLLLLRSLAVFLLCIVLAACDWEVL